jgi:hypothetical protein
MMAGHLPYSLQMNKEKMMERQHAMILLSCVVIMVAVSLFVTKKQEWY